MKKAVINIVALVLISVVTGVMATADTMTEYVKFAHPVIVNGTLVDDGMYKAEFNEQTGILTIKEGNDIVATAPARLERMDEDSPVEYTTRDQGDTHVLLSLTMDDGYRAVLSS
jgi:hypothetical protein